MMYCNNGEILDTRETSDVIFTIGNMLADDWQIIDMDDEEFDLSIKTIRFGEALREAKAGKRITRKAWDYSGKRCVVYQKGYPKGIPCNKQTAKAWGIEEGENFRCEPYLQIETGYNQEDATHETYTPTNDDLFAEDWYVEK